METIGDALGKYLGEKLGTQPKEKKRGGINSERADLVYQLLVFMGEDKTLDEERAIEAKAPGEGRKAKAKRINTRMKYWLGRTRKVQPGDLYAMMKAAKEGKNPQALFNHLLKTKYGKK